MSRALIRRGRLTESRQVTPTGGSSLPCPRRQNQNASLDQTRTKTKVLLQVSRDILPVKSGSPQSPFESLIPGSPQILARSLVGGGPLGDFTHQLGDRLFMGTIDGPKVELSSDVEKYLIPT